MDSKKLLRDVAEKTTEHGKWKVFPIALAELLEAGQAMRLATQGTFPCERKAANKYDAAVAKVEAEYGSEV